MPEVLKYQANRTLDSVSAYTVSLQLRLLPSQQKVFLGLKTHGFDIYFDPDPVLHYDLEGRFVKWAEPNHYLRRTFSHRVLETTKLAAETGGGIRRQVLPKDAADKLVDSVARKMKGVTTALAQGKCLVEYTAPSRDEALKQIVPLLEKTATFNAKAARADTERFSSIYRPVAILPPDQYNALVLQATEGCAYNKCTFCGFYQHAKFHAKTPAEFRKHVQAAIAYHGGELASRRGIFLEQANALTIPMPRLLEIFRVLNETCNFPPPELEGSAQWWLGHPLRFDGVYSFVDAFTGKMKTVEDYRALRQLHLRRVYLGMESGDNDLLKFLNKPVTTEVVTETVRRMKDAGLSVALIVLLGAGGGKYFDRHVVRTLAAIRQMSLCKGDQIYLSPLVEVPGAIYFARARKAGIEILPPQRIQEQEKAFRAGLQFSNPANRPTVARYDIEQFVY
jgi:radical SAM superfamily enzyme YgiQ (UPF0313 family)